MITKFENINNNVEYFLVKKDNNRYYIYLIVSIYKDNKHYTLKGWKILSSKLHNDIYVNGPGIFSIHTNLKEFENKKFLTIDELFEEHEDLCIEVYEYLKQKNLILPGVVRFKHFLDALKKSESLMLTIKTRKYNI